MSYTALYRKFRPTTFEDVKGQDHIVTTLKNQLRAGRIGHAYLFCGTRGTGKTTVAKILARAVNCEHPVDGSPCNECDTCRNILAGTSSNVIEIDAASNNGVDNIREIREEVTYRPTQGRYKVYIIDEVHMLSAGAFNALLKTLEEPPEYVIFILATTEVNKIPVTILSRCQRYNFHRITIDTIADRLKELLAKEGVEAEEKAVRYVAKAADGSMRDALSLLDQCIAFYLGQTLTYEKVLDVLGTVDTEVFSSLLRRIIDGDASGSIRILADCVKNGKEMGQFVNDFTWYMRNLMLVQSSDDLEDVLDVSAENLKQLKEESTMIDRESLIRYIKLMSDLSGQIRFAAQKQILVETALIRLCRPQMDTDLSGVLDRIRVLEKKIEEGIAVRPEAFGSMNAAPAAAQAQANAAEPPRVAAPEELQEIAGRWKQIIDRVGGPLQGVLMQAWKTQKVPQYDGRTGNPVIYVTLDGATEREYANTEDSKALILDTIREVLQKNISVEFKAVSTGQTDVQLNDIPVQELIGSRVGMDFDTFDGSEEEFDDPEEFDEDI